MKVSWHNRIVLPALLITTILMGFSSPAFCEDASAGAVVELNKIDRDALAILGKGVVGKALPAWPIKDTARLMPFRKGKWTYQITAGDREGKRQVMSISKTDREGEPNLWDRSVVGDCTEFFSVKGGGAVNLVSEIYLKQDVIVHYTPMLPIMFDGMKPGDKAQVETEIKIYDLHDPTFLKYSGRLKVIYTYLGVYEITVPAGKYEAVLIKSSYKGKVGPAHVVDGGYTFYARDVGMVA
ncbi:MAG: hypothetical protein JRD04_11445, partial [Deltaproteobacteria bacterium]|nr:hypothetical protein [Deltaproteobacteria bacterium]